MATTGLIFAGTIMILNGVFQFFQGIAGVARDDVYVTVPKYTFKFDVTTWGWIHLIVGLIVAITGIFVLKSAPWARGVGIGLVAFSAFTNFLFLPYVPLWAVTIIALDVFIIWALVNAPRRG
jgi:hypothetical protein